MFWSLERACFFALEVQLQEGIETAQFLGVLLVNSELLSGTVADPQSLDQVLGEEDDFHGGLQPHLLVGVVDHGLEEAGGVGHDFAALLGVVGGEGEAEEVRVEEHVSFNHQNVIIPRPNHPLPDLPLQLRHLPLLLLDILRHHQLVKLSAPS